MTQYHAVEPYHQNHRAEYDALANAKHRCHNPKNKQAKDYGDRGIIVADEWRNGHDGFKSFFEHIGPRPEGGYTLDRLDNDKGYVPGNVAWRTRSENQMNRRVTASPEQMAIWQDAADKVGCSLASIRNRVTRGTDIYAPYHANKVSTAHRAQPARLTPETIDLEQVAANLLKLPAARIPARRLRNEQIRKEFMSGKFSVVKLTEKYSLKMSMILNIVWGRA